MNLIPRKFSGQTIKMRMGKVRSQLAGFWKEYSKSKMGVVGIIILAFIIIMLLLAPAIYTHNPRLMTEDKLLSPSTAHLLGTDNKGRDLFSLLLSAGRVSVTFGVVCAATVISISTIMGLLAGYFGGIIDEILMRIADLLRVLPRLPLLIVLASMLQPGLTTIAIIIIVLGWVRPARQIRALTLSLKQYEYVESTKASGGGSLYIIFNHILPNVVGIVVAHFVMEVVAIILMETGLSFLGFGDPLRFSWGRILGNAQTAGALSEGWWWWWLPTGLAITTLCFSLAFIGTTLNDRFVLRLRIRGKD